MKKTLLIVALLALAGCNNEFKDANFPARPEELKDCKIVELYNTQGERLTVARCPNSTTSTQFKRGKGRGTAIVVDGVTYEAKE